MGNVKCYGFARFGVRWCSENVDHVVDVHFKLHTPLDASRNTNGVCMVEILCLGVGWQHHQVHGSVVLFVFLGGVHQLTVHLTHPFP